MASLNAQYNVASPNSLPVRIAARARRKMYQLFLDEVAPSQSEFVLDVGVTSEREYEASNYLEAWLPNKERITAVGLDDASFLETAYPGILFCHADGCELPFRDSAFDVIHSSAVLEHVGGDARQRRFICELARSARRAVFITTPNRWFPIEFHSVLPFVHWLPQSMFRKFLRFIGHADLAEEKNLNLLGRRDVQELCRDLCGWHVEQRTISMFGWPSNLILILRRTNDI
jgi:Methylase involved in ubiquinone/menaquinone biosynthesis